MASNIKKLSLANLKDLPETLLYPLKARYVETKKKNGLISDPKSVEILDRLDYDPTKANLVSISQLGVCLRTIIFDEQVFKFLQAYPEGIVVNLGCGLDTRFTRLDNGKVQWFDLDLPDVIDFRKYFFSETARHQFIVKSILDSSWTEQIPKNKKILFVVEGLSFYLTENENRCLLRIIMEHFPGSDCLIEILASWYIKIMTMTAGKKKYHDPLDSKVALLLKWGVNNGRELDKWFEGMKFVEEWFVVQKKLDAFPLSYRLCCLLIPSMARVNKIVHLHFM